MKLRMMLGLLSAVFVAYAVGGSVWLLAYGKISDAAADGGYRAGPLFVIEHLSVVKSNGADCAYYKFQAGNAPMYVVQCVDSFSRENVAVGMSR